MTIASVRLEARRPHCPTRPEGRSGPFVGCLHASISPVPFRAWEQPR